MESGRREPAGRLRVSAPVHLGRHCVAPVLAKVAAQHPKLELELSLSDRRVDLIEDGFDLAIRTGNIRAGAGLMTRTIGLQRMTVCGAPTYLAKHGRPERLDDLAHHTGIAYGRAGQIRSWEFPASEGKMLVEATPPSRLRFDDIEALPMPPRPATALLGCPPGWSATRSAPEHSFHCSGTCRAWYSSHRRSGRRHRICPCACGSPLMRSPQSSPAPLSSQNDYLKMTRAGGKPYVLVGISRAAARARNNSKSSGRNRTHTRTSRPTGSTGSGVRDSSAPTDSNAASTHRFRRVDSDKPCLVRGVAAPDEVSRCMYGIGVSLLRWAAIERCRGSKSYLHRAVGRN